MGRPSYDEAAAEALIAQAASGATISHLSAALAYRWPVLRLPERPTLTIPRHRKPPRGVQARWSYADLSETDVQEGRTTTPVRTVIDCARAYPKDEALAVADSAIRSGLLTATELRTAAERSLRTGRNRVRWVAEHASGLAANPFESALRAAALAVPGLEVRAQGWVGRAGRADLVDDRLLIAIEADSWEHHGSAENFRRDVRRYTEFARLGWVVARFVHEDVMQHPDRVRRQLSEIAAVRNTQLALSGPR